MPSNAPVGELWVNSGGRAAGDGLCRKVRSGTVQTEASQAPWRAAMVYLVRHAHAGSQKRWSGSDHDRPLSVRGQQQADGLVEVLGEYPVARILTSPRVRCRDTGGPARPPSGPAGRADTLTGRPRIRGTAARAGGRSLPAGGGAVRTRRADQEPPPVARRQHPHRRSATAGEGVHLDSRPGRGPGRGCPLPATGAGQASGPR